MTATHHALTIDLEEQFQLRTGGRGVPERHWDRFPSRIERNVDVALQVLDRRGAKATFFAGLWVAERHARALREIATAGHEIACRIERLPRRGAARSHGCVSDVSKLISRIEDGSGRVVHGCRVANLDGGVDGLTDDVLPAQVRFVCRPGRANVSDAIRPATAGQVTEITLPSLRVAGATVGLRSGTGLRLMPHPLARHFISAWGRRAVPAVFDFKLWELDPDPTELSVFSPLERKLHYRNLSQFEDRLEALLGQAQFVAIRDLMGLADEPLNQSAEPSTRSLDARQAATLSGASGTPVSIVIPCYNEEAGLGYLAKALNGLATGLGRRHELSFVIVDDGSTDATWAEMNRLFGADARFRLVRHDRNRGVGAAILTGIDAAPAETIAVIDSDCSYDPARIEDMLPLLAPDVALVTASPYHALGRVEGVPEWRLVLSRSASRLYRMILRNKLATYTSCFRVVRKSATKGLVLRHEGFIGVAEMLARLDLGGCKIVEHPAVLESRLIGRSKLKVLRVIAGHLQLLAEISLARIAARRSWRVYW
ncbi:MAG: glycosyltransferase [Rhodobacteraceae bacterium]|nr:glycosyltransferase [Paracoccaceae bacterium]